MKLEHLVINNITEKTEVKQCPDCGKEYFREYEKKFIVDFGTCVYCDKKYGC